MAHYIPETPGSAWHWVSQFISGLHPAREQCRVMLMLALMALKSCEPSVQKCDCVLKAGYNLYLLYWSVNSRKCSLWKTWGEGMFSWTYIHTGSDILSIHSTPRMYIYLCSMVSCRCCQSAWTDIVICLRNILQDYTPLSFEPSRSFRNENTEF